MKIVSRLLLFALPVLLYACGPSVPVKPGSTGKPFDVLVVMNDTLWLGPAGDTLKAILTENPMLLPQPEPMHDVLQVNPEEVNNLLLRQSNLILFREGTQEQPSMTVEYDVYSRPQAVVRISGPSARVMTDYMAANRFALQGIFEIAERERALATANQYVDRDIRDTLLNRFGLRMNIPKGYQIRTMLPDFARISYEPAMYSQGLIIYTYPLTVGRDSTFTRAALIESRDRFVGRIPGPNTGSFMRTADHVVMPLLSTEIIDGRLWVKTQGLWDLENGFMGGPFISYSTVNVAENEVLTVDLYVYSPRNPKRNYMKFLEAIMQTARIPADTAGRVPPVDTPR